MTILSHYSPEEIEQIVSLPYRAGMNVSYAEDEDGERDDELEMQALENTIQAFATNHEGEALTKEIAAEIINRKDQWETWSQGVFNIEPACEKAINALKTHAGEAEIKDYIKMVLDISNSVAQSYGEFGEGAHAPTGFMAKISSVVKSVVSSGSGEEAHPMNVSAAEDTAISNIAKALKSAV